jgi:hypothetical protein
VTKRPFCGIKRRKNRVNMAKMKRTVERLLEFGDVRVPILEIPVDHAPPLVLGGRGAKAVLEHLDDIRSFVSRNEITRAALEQLCEAGLTEDSGG